MKRNIGTAIATTLLLVIGQTVMAGDVVGYNKIDVPANSDVLVSVPFNNEVAGEYTVASTASATITVDEALSADTYDSAYYVRIVSGSGDGLWSTVSSNGAGTLTVEDQAVVDELVADDEIRVYPHHTVAGLFPAGLEDVSYDSQTRLLVYEGAVAGQNKVQALTLQYAVAAPLFNGWNNGVPGSDYNNQVLTPGSHVRIRNGSGEALSYIPHGTVPDHSISMILPGSTADDVIVSTGYPVGITMAESGLENAGSVLLYDNEATGQNKVQQYTLNYAVAPPLFDGWNNGVPGSDFNDELINGSEGFIIRRDGSEGEVTVTIPKPY